MIKDPLSANNMKNVIERFDEYLTSRGLKFEATIIGGAALNILKISDRRTVDVDCLDPEVSDEIKKAALEFRDQNPELRLISNWINNGPDSLVRDLPPDWESRLILGFEGKNIKLLVLGRIDLLKTKLFAYCDRTNPDYADLLNLKPTKEELSQCIAWVKERDGNPMWPDLVEKRFLALSESLYG